MKHLKLNLILIILAASVIICWGLTYLVIGTLLVSGWSSDIFGSNLAIIGNFFAIIINLSGVLVLAIGIAIIVLAAIAKKKFGTSKKELTTYRILTSVADCFLLLMTVFNPFFWMSASAIIIPSMIYVAFVIFTAIFTLVNAFSYKVENNTEPQNE